MSQECPLCVDHPYQFYADDVASARLSDEFACRGHAVLVARRHVEHVSDLEPGEAARFFATYRSVERALLTVFEADRVLAVKLGLAVAHLHIHLYPVSRETDRPAVDAILARETRLEVSDLEVREWIERLRHEMSADME